MEIDSNSWYSLTIAGQPSQWLAGTYPYINGDTGIVSITNSDDNTPSQQWQFFPHNSSTYLLRTKASGSNGYLATSSSSRTCEDEVPVIYNNVKADESMLWTIQPNSDETYRLSNRVHGRTCYLEIKENGVQMSSRTTPGLDQLFAPIRHGEINDVVFSAAATLPVSRIGVNTPSATASSTLSRSVLQGSTTFSHASSSTPSSSSSALPLPPPLALRHDSRLSKSAALGIGVAVGIIGILLFISIALLIYRRYKLRHSPSSRHYRQTKLWKGFVPATPNTARTTFVETKMANIYFAELPTPATPAFMASPPLEENIGDRVSWNRGNRTSWPVSPITPGSPPIEMPI